MIAVLCLVTQSCLSLCDPMDCNLPGSSVLGNSPGKNTRMGCHALLQGIFPTQGSNPGLISRQILYHLSHQGSPRILEWVAYPFSRGTSWPRSQVKVSCIASRFFTSWATWEAPLMISNARIFTPFFDRELIIKLSSLSVLEMIIIERQIILKVINTFVTL